MLAGFMSDPRIVGGGRASPVAVLGVLASSVPGSRDHDFAVGGERGRQSEEARSALAVSRRRCCTVTLSAGFHRSLGDPIRPGFVRVRAGPRPREGL